MPGGTIMWKTPVSMLFLPSQGNISGFIHIFNNNVLHKLVLYHQLRFDAARNLNITAILWALLYAQKWQLT